MLAIVRCGPGKNLAHFQHVLAFKNLIAPRMHRGRGIARRAKREQPRALALGMRAEDNRPERAAECRALFPNIFLSRATRFGRPFRAISLCVSFPGLKPWAILCSPFGRLNSQPDAYSCNLPSGT